MSTAAGGDPWDPLGYLRFGGERHLAAADLLARIDCPRPEIVHDVGCGTGTLARAMADRWPGARVIGSDRSAAMLAEAAAIPSPVEWRHLDVASWPPDEVADVITANAVLHWVADHDPLILRMLASVRPGGALAVQMPRSWDEPSHLAVRQALDATGAGSPALRRRLTIPPVASPEHYHRLLAARCDRVDIWETRYLHVLPGPDAVLRWLEGTTLRPVLADLGDQAPGYLAELGARLAEAYPRQPDGTTLYPFPRVFIVAYPAAGSEK